MNHKLAKMPLSGPAPADSVSIRTPGSTSGHFEAPRNFIDALAFNILPLQHVAVAAGILISTRSRWSTTGSAPMVGSSTATTTPALCFGREKSLRYYKRIAALCNAIQIPHAMGRHTVAHTAAAVALKTGRMAGTLTFSDPPAVA